jgi:preprotein translocase subunit SecA
MTGTANTEAEEFATIYNLRVVEVPTNIPVARVDEADIIYRTKEEKFKAIAEDIAACQKKGQPVLVGTTSIEKSEELSALLKKHKVKHQVLNARYHEQEADIVAQAGRKGAVTIATNMAGRGTDIKLGGNLDLLLENVENAAEVKKITAAHAEEKNAVMAAGGLRVIGTERHESRRIDNQLRGRSGRQGDVGSSAFYISLQDDLMRIFASGLDGLMQRLDMPEGERIQSRLISRALETAQRKIESRNFDVRKHLLKFDDVLNEQRKVIYEQRRELINSPTVSDVVEDFRAEALDLLHARCFPLGSHEEDWQTDVFNAEFASMFNLKVDVKTLLQADDATPEDILTALQKQQAEVWQQKTERLGAALIQRLEKAVLLQVLDTEWKDHLQRLDDLRKGITLRGYGQKDPVNEFKREAFSMFEHLLGAVRDETVRILSHQDMTEEELEDLRAKQQQMAEAQRKQAELAAAVQSGMQVNAVQPGQAPSAEALANVPEGVDPFAHLELSRNAACPCGSGKRYKHCHGRFPAMQQKSA